MKIQHFENGMTVRELKELIKHWPDKDIHDEDNEVWLFDHTSYTSNQCRSITPLNITDILFE